MEKPQSSTTDNDNVIQIPGFLTLPAELRNQIYEYAAQNETSISLRDGRTLYCPALSLVCRQVRKEYESIYSEVVPLLNLNKIHIHIADFLRTDMSATIRRIEAFEETSTDREYVVRVFLTNYWQPRDLRMFCMGALLNHGYERIRYPQKKRSYDVQIHFDPRTFDVDACQQTLLKLDEEISRANMWWFLEDNYEDWPRAEKAFWDAFEWCRTRNDDGDDGDEKTKRRIQADEDSSSVKRRRLCAAPDCTCGS